MFIQDPNFFHPRSDFFPSRISIKEFKYLNPKDSFQALGNMIWVVHPASGIFTHPGSRGQKGTGSRIRNTSSKISRELFLNYFKVILLSWLTLTLLLHSGYRAGPHRAYLPQQSRCCILRDERLRKGTCMF